MSCSALTTINLPRVSIIPLSTFYSCRGLTDVSIPEATLISANAFAGCSSLASVSFPKVSNIYSSAFARCYNLTSLTLGSTAVCALSNSNAFTSTPIGGYSAIAGKFGSIYVPASLLASYKAASNWSYFSSRFVGI